MYAHWLVFQYLISISKRNSKRENVMPSPFAASRQIAQKHGRSLLPEEGLGEGGEGAGGGRGGEGRPGEGEGQQPEQGAREGGTLAQRASKA
jgi:hypothetical protein